MRNPLARRREKSQFRRASDGSMTLMEHIRELRDRMFRATLGIAVGLVVGFLLSNHVYDLLRAPYCDLLIERGEVESFADCTFYFLKPADGFTLKLKLSLWVGLIVSAPVWLYQVWAFIAPGLHRSERKWAYMFAALAAPLFALGAVLAYFVADKGLGFLMDTGFAQKAVQLEVIGYISFMTSLILIFGVAFEFPLVLLMLNFTGMVSGRKMLGWWRAAVFTAFAFAALTTPDPGPFTMTLFAGALSLLFFITVGVCLLNDKRKGRGKEIYEGLDDDEVSSLDDYDVDQVEAGASVAPAAPLERRYDDMT